ncbi:MAG: hypothetical protein IJM50_07100 [Lachnospiraceae bacterium]|nr:hypothetical protein [Lachnospiraceae bacterium]
MILETTLSELEEFLYKYDELLGWAEGVEIPSQNDDQIRLGIANYRIQIPEMNLSLRSGELLCQTEAENHSYDDSNTGKSTVVDNPPSDDVSWEVDASIVLVYDINELDPAEYLEWSTDGYQGTVYDHVWPKFKNFGDLDSVKCIIDTSEFMIDEDRAASIAKECEEYYA